MPLRGHDASRVIRIVGLAYVVTICFRLVQHVIVVARIATFSNTFRVVIKKVLDEVLKLIAFAELSELVIEHNVVSILRGHYPCQLYEFLAAVVLANWKL